MRENSFPFFLLTPFFTSFIFSPGIAELGLTQKELANRTAIKQPMIARIEKGQIPTLPTLQKITQALDSSITITGNKVSIIANYNVSNAA